MTVTPSIFLLVAAYFLDEILNALIGFNVSGSILLIFLGIIVVTSKFKSALFSTAANFNIIAAIAVTITLFSIISFGMPSGCMIKLKGGVSIIIFLAIAFFFNIIRAYRIATDKIVSSCLLFLFSVSLVFDIFGLGLMQTVFGTPRPSGPYSEPSHLAMYLLPIVTYRLLIDWRNKLTISTLILAFLIAPTTTLMLGIVAIISFALFRKNGTRETFQKYLFTMLFILLIYFLWLFGFVNLSEIINRIENIFNGNNINELNHINVSSAVWLNGWSQAYETFIETNGFGTGFNQMGCGRFYEIGYFSPMMRNAVLNAEDGSFMASKLVAELGVLGIIIVIALTVFSFNVILSARKSSCNFTPVEHKVRMANIAGALSILIFIYVRSAGYFQLPVLVAISLLFMSAPPKTLFKNV